MGLSTLLGANDSPDAQAQSLDSGREVCYSQAVSDVSGVSPDSPGAAKRLDAEAIKLLLAGKRNLTPKPQTPKPDHTPSGHTISDSDWVRPKWHGWVYGGQRNPTL